MKTSPVRFLVLLSALMAAGCGQSDAPGGGEGTGGGGGVAGAATAGRGGSSATPTAPIPGQRSSTLKITRGLKQWPQFAFSAANVAATDARVPVTPTLAWQLDLPIEVAYATPIVGDGRLFVTMYGAIAAVDARSGAVLWTNRDLKLGKYGTPAYKDGRMFVAAGSSGEKISTITAVDVSNGTEVWRSELSSWGALKIEGDALFATALAKASDGGTTFALDLVTGATRWQVQTGCTSDPAVFAGRVYCAGIGALVSVSAETGEEQYRRSTGAALSVSAPAIADDKIVFIAEDAVFAHRLSDGDLLWRAPFQPANRQQMGGTWIETSPAIAYGKVFVLGDGHVTALDAATGTQIWSVTVGVVGGTTVAVADGTVLVNGTWLLDAESGHLLWSAPPEFIGYGTPVIIDGHFYAARDSRLFAWTGAVPGEPLD